MNVLIATERKIHQVSARTIKTIKMRISTWTVLKAVQKTQWKIFPVPLTFPVIVHWNKHINSRDNLPRSSVSPCDSLVSTLIPVRILSARKTNYCATFQACICSRSRWMVWFCCYLWASCEFDSQTIRGGTRLCVSVTGRQGEDWAMISKAWKLELCLALNIFK